MPYGYLITAVVWGFCTLLAVAPPRPRRSNPSNTSFWLAYVVNELPFVVAAWVVWGTVQVTVDGDLGTWAGVIGLAISGVTTAGLVIVVARATRGRHAVEEELAANCVESSTTPLSHWTLGRWVRIVLWPFPWWRRLGVTRSGTCSTRPIIVTIESMSMDHVTSPRPVRC